MAGAIGDINQGLIGISHTTGTKQNDMPAKKMVVPNAGSTITVHTASALNLEDSSTHIMKFIRGDKLDSYGPQDQKEFRASVLKSVETLSTGSAESDQDAINQLKALLQRDEKLEMMAIMARNVLISV